MSRRVLAAVGVMCLVVVSASGCAVKVRDIPTRPMAQRPAVLVLRDQRECDRAVTGKVKGPWLPGELEFAACMIARNYQTFVQILDAPVEVRKASPRATLPAARVLADLIACERTVEGNITLAEKIGRPTVAFVGLFVWPVGVGSTMMSPALAGQRERDYTACMMPRGYVVLPWTPDVEPRSPPEQTP